jgi:hypothetical protein
LRHWRSWPSDSGFDHDVRPERQAGADGKRDGMTPEEHLAREAIRYTQSVYNSEGDRGRIDGLLSAFTDDGVLELERGVFSGKAAIREGLSSGVEARRQAAGDAGRPRGLLRHNLTTSRVEITGEATAEAWTYFFVVTSIGLDHSGVYIDRFRRTDERWLISHRRVKVEWEAENSTYFASLRGN